MRQLRILGFPELKNHQTEIDAIDVSATNPRFVICNELAQGSGASQRVGRQVKMQSFHSRFYFSSRNPDGEVARVSVFWDMQHNAGETLISSPNLIFQDAASFVSDVFGFRNLSNTKRFIMLYDKAFLIQPQAIFRETSTQAPNHGRWIEINIPLKGQTVNYEGTGGTIAEIATGALYMLFQFQGGIGPTTQALVQGTTRVRFSDV